MSKLALLTAAKKFEADVVIPHCKHCVRPCCGLSDVVLELSFAQVQTLYAITRKKQDFDQSLPAMIRKQGDRYYAHGEPCPAYTQAKTCSIYSTSLKPQSCSDFPLYDDGDAVTVDLRCEAVREHLEELRTRLRAVAGARFQEESDSDHPDVFLSFVPSAPPPSQTPPKRPKPPASSS